MQKQNGTGEEEGDGATIDLPGFIVTYQNFDEKAPDAYTQHPLPYNHP